MTEPHFSERSASLESYLRPKTVLLTRAHKCLPNPLRVPFVCKPPSLRYSLEPAILRRVTDSGRLGLAATATLLTTSLYDIFFHINHDENSAPKNKNELNTQLPNVFPHSIIHIRDRGVGSEDRLCPTHVILVKKKNHNMHSATPPSR